MLPRWHVEIYISWRSPKDQSEAWWKIWKRSTGEVMERTVVVEDVVFYAATSVLATVLYVAR